MWESHDFSIIYDLTWIVDKTTRVPDTMGHLANLIHLFLTSCPEKNAQIKCYLAWPILTTHWWMLKLTANWKCHKTIFWYPKVDGDSIRSYIANLSFQFSSKTELLPSSLNGSSQAWIILSQRENINRNQRASFGSCQNVLLPKPTITDTTISTTENDVVGLLQHSKLPVIIAREF